ncbi:hypothetical protein [Burkholderia pseudomallei]|uniref:hypothetical protein n=1 Tax=Burkholderia pseudomallei TaxID=28450 RepID=UPI000F0781E6|nr:hypothetical protein [Burkholderia pseudomallei]
MVDKLTAEHRSALMRSVRRRDTSPEMAVRRALHKLVTCLISSGHFNLGERPRLLQLNNTAA